MYGAYAWVEAGTVATTKPTGKQYPHPGQKHVQLSNKTTLESSRVKPSKVECSCSKYIKSTQSFSDLICELRDQAFLPVLSHRIIIGIIT